MFADKLQPGDEIRIIAPSTSMAMVKGKQIELAKDRFNKLGFSVSFGKNVEVHDEFFISSIEERLEDFHDAFRDQNVKGILSAVGGYNSNQLLNYLDYDLIKAESKGVLRLWRYYRFKFGDLSENGTGNLFRSSFLKLWKCV